MNYFTVPKANREGIRPGITDNLKSGKVINKIGSFEKRFTHKLYRDEEDFLQAYVMINDIVVLVPGQTFDPSVIKDICWNEFERSVGSMHGKRKKGAPKVKADDCICVVNFKDGTSCELKTPIAGQLIELNEKIITNFEKLGNNDHYNGERYVAIIYPTTKVPGPQDVDIEVWKQKQLQASTSTRICYAYLEGKCTRGSNCRFQHEDVPDANDESIVMTKSES